MWRNAANYLHLLTECSAPCCSTAAAAASATTVSPLENGIRHEPTTATTAMEWIGGSKKQNFLFEFQESSNIAVVVVVAACPRQKTDTH